MNFLCIWTGESLIRHLNLLRLHPLVVRREVADVVFLYKIFNFEVVCPPLLERIVLRLPSATRSRRLFVLGHLNRNYLQFSSVPRIRLSNEVYSGVDFFCNQLGALRRAVLMVRLETFESEQRTMNDKEEMPAENNVPGHFSERHQDDGYNSDALHDHVINRQAPNGKQMDNDNYRPMHH
ncbi:hypothetical protein J6590_081146 [Homalodisca vitripennis]|nr:hypothetical protein J6590_081146 [Homalodisca vitripennis]